MGRYGHCKNATKSLGIFSVPFLNVTVGFYYFQNKSSHISLYILQILCETVRNSFRHPIFSCSILIAPTLHSWNTTICITSYRALVGSVGYNVGSLIILHKLYIWIYYIIIQSWCHSFNTGNRIFVWKSVYKLKPQYVTFGIMVDKQ